MPANLDWICAPVSFLKVFLAGGAGPDERPTNEGTNHDVHESVHDFRVFMILFGFGWRLLAAIFSDNASCRYRSWLCMRPANELLRKPDDLRGKACIHSIARDEELMCLAAALVASSRRDAQRRH